MPIVTKHDDVAKVWTFCGAVLMDREENYYDDSDGYVIVWNDEKEKLEKHYTWTTRGYSLTNGWVDATPEVIEKAKAWMRDWARPLVKDALLKEAYKIQVGNQVKVVAGRKLPKGTVARVLWVGEGKNFNPYSKEKGPLQVRLQLEDGRVEFTSYINVEKIMEGRNVVDGEVQIDQEVLESRVKKLEGAFMLPFAHLPIF